MDIRIESTTGKEFFQTGCIKSKIQQLCNVSELIRSLSIHHLYDDDEMGLYRVRILVVTDQKEIIKADSGYDGHVVLANLLQSLIEDFTESTLIKMVPIRNKVAVELLSAS